MRITTRLFGSAMLAALVALAPTVAPSDAGAQERDHKSNQDKDKAEKRERKAERKRARTGNDDRTRVTQSRWLDDIPPAQRPASGLCRIVIDGVPSSRRSAPMACATAVRNRPANGRVLYLGSAAGEVDRPRDSRARPSMRDAELFYEGQRPSSIARLVPGATRVTLSDRVNGVPTLARFYDANGTLLQVWRDTNADGRADQITRGN